MRRTLLDPIAHTIPPCGKAFGALIALLLAAACGTGSKHVESRILAAYREGAEYTALPIEYPLDETLFPPEIAAPTFRWKQPDPRCDAYLFTIQFADDEHPLLVLVDSTEWTPGGAQWEAIRKQSLEAPAQLLVLGVSRDDPDTILAAGRLSFSTSKDEVGAPLFYREVNLPFIEAVKDPSRIRWRFGAISSEEPPPIVLEGLPVCGNCHSFSADGAVLGMDVDYARDKGSYAIQDVGEEIVLDGTALISWTDYKRDDGQKTFGLLSQVSPDGKYVISTVKDRSIFVPRPDLAFSQLFFPIRGILAVYERATGKFRALPGADDPQYVQSNPSWSPDGTSVVFARAKAHRLAGLAEKTEALLTPEECREFLEEGKPFPFDLYRVPFNDGQGGQPEPIPGASGNGMSNYFARYSPDGKWIVFCKSKNYMLLQEDSELHVIPAQGGEARRLRCNTPRMNSWHTWSPNGKWLAFSSKANGPYTQIWLTHVDENARTTPPVVLSRMTSPDRAVNIPEFVNVAPDAIHTIREAFLDAESFIRAGETFIHTRNDLDGAIAKYKRALEIDPQSAEAHVRLGTSLRLKDQPDEARTHFLEALRIEPERAEAHYALGVLLTTQDKDAEALDRFLKALELKPDSAQACFQIGQIWARRGKVNEALTHFSTAVQLDPTYDNAHVAMAVALRRLGQLDRSIEHFRKALQLNPTLIPAHYDLGVILFQQGELAKAIGHLSQVTKADPENAKARAALGAALLANGNPKASAAELREAARLAPQNTMTIVNLAEALAQSGDFAQAIDQAQQALRLAAAQGNQPLTQEMTQRLERYRQGKPFRVK